MSAITASHPLAEGLAPLWASAWGEDVFGVWAAFELEGVEQRMRWIPPGRFQMGSPESEAGRWKDEGPQHEVTLTRGFWLGETAVTQELWEAVMGPNPSELPDNAQRPVTSVSWEDCQGFFEAAEALLTGLALRLPTEAEWEYACRAGTTTRYAFGDEISKEQANFESDQAAPVRSFPPTPWGLYEMHGNVWEWCQDYWQDQYSEGPVDDPTGPREGAVRVIRGGSWISVARLVRSACRDWYASGVRLDFLGIRLARGQG